MAVWLVVAIEGVAFDLEAIGGHYGVNSGVCWVVFEKKKNRLREINYIVALGKETISAVSWCLFRRKIDIMLLMKLETI